MKEFIEKLKTGEQYANIVVTHSVLLSITKLYNDSEYYINYIKQKNDKYDDDEELKELRKQRAKVNSKIIEREQKLNKK